MWRRRQEGRLCSTERSAVKFLWVHATHATSHLGFRRLFSHRDMQSWKAVCDHTLCFRHAGQMERQRSCHQSILVCRMFGTCAFHDMLIFVGLASRISLCKLDLVTSKGFWKLWGSQLGLQAYRLQTLRNCLIENHTFVVEYLLRAQLRPLLMAT